MFQTSELGKLIHTFFRKCWSVVLKFVKVYSLPYISYCIRMMDILGGSKSIAIVLPLIFMPISTRKGWWDISASASLFHMSHLKRDLDIVRFIKTTANICGSNKVKQWIRKLLRTWWYRKGCFGRISHSHV